MHRAELERAVAARVAGLVEGRGIPRARVTAAVRQVVAALPYEPPAAAATGSAPTVLAAFAAARPDLASATRAACTAAGVAIASLGTGRAGRHTVVTLIAPAVAQAALAGVARSLGAAMTVLDAPAG